MFGFVGRYWMDILAWSVSVVVVVGGFYLAWHGSPFWVNRAGSLLVVIGVLLAASRLHDWLQKKSATFVDDNFNVVFEGVTAIIAKTRGKNLAVPLRDDLQSTLKNEIHECMTSIFEAGRARSNLFEIYFVVVGTLLNGFGDYGVCLFKICNP